VGPFRMMLIGAAALCLSAGLSRWAGHVISQREGEREQKKDVEILGQQGGFQLLISDPCFSARVSTVRRGSWGEGVLALLLLS